MILQSYRSIGLDGNLCDIYGLAHAIAHVFDGQQKAAQRLQPTPGTKRQRAKASDPALQHTAAADLQSSLGDRPNTEVMSHDCIFFSFAGTALPAAQAGAR
jgi:hypothetical protein